ncbi:MAG TPA: di-heme-cytochrome C peroxidase [Bryobacteraceae bacterium]|nr:di-heme-cytochrome C peroxidase [Bryobacteraceae bacterium]
MRPFSGIAAVCLFALPACSSRTADQKGLKSTPPAAAYSPNGWSDAERAEYYHLSEGSELLPYAVLANVISTKTGKPFLEGMARFGFLPDSVGPSNPHGMPVGLTAAPSRSSLNQGLEMVGFNCAACHTGQLTYRGSVLRIDGAPALINLQGYQIEFRDSLDATLKDPKKLFTLLVAMSRQQKAPPPENIDQYAGDPSLVSAGDTPARSTADPNFHSLPSKTADAPAPARKSPGFAQRLRDNLTILKARLAYLNHGKLILDGTEPGPGRVDAFGAARNFLFPKQAMKMQSPVSFPFIWGVPDPAAQPDGQITWIHYDGNTNSILERNIGQALGMGAVYDPRTFESTLRIANLHRLEALTRKLSPPKWPAALLGPIDQAKAAGGEKVFNAKCQGCHQDSLIPLMEIGVDPNRANSFGQNVGAVSFPDGIAPLLAGLKKRAFEDDGISEPQRAAMDAKKVVWRSTGKYKARRLQGVWATAPYLHNGSVPTLYHLLHPEQRPSQFNVGNREYDPQRVGYRSDLPGWLFNSTQPGNSNIGHSGDRFGTNLPEEQKAQLLEYLKTL